VPLDLPLSTTELLPLAFVGEQHINLFDRIVRKDAGWTFPGNDIDEIKIKVTPENVPGGTLKITLISADGEFVAFDEVSAIGETVVTKMR
jgi:hypothetical protein